MDDIFSGPILGLKEADLPFEGGKAYLSQSEDHQILFIQFDKDIPLPEHSHEAQWAVVLEGEARTYTKGDRYYVPAGAKHSGRIYAGYADITFFNQSDRYKCK
ncbi:MAG TPA: cupin domain-containing protein [Negativicutes bacterium]|nr:cupin domain-containing protein [Negativicutes bacterium]